MEKKIVGYIPRILFKVYLYLKNKFDPKPPITFEEESSVEICKKLIKKERTRLTFAPKSFKRFIKNDDYDMFIVINNNCINLINHVYSYTVYIENQELYQSLVEEFDLELERTRQDLEDEIRTNIKHSLQNILHNIN